MNDGALPVPGVSGEAAKAAQETAKAAQEIAKTTGKALDLVGGSAGYLAAVLGQLPHDTVGILGDMAKRARQRLAQRAEQKLLERGVAAPELPSPSLLLPLLERADKETREELLELWASLLASAMEPGRARRIRRDFFTTLENMEPQDALVLARIASGTQGSALRVAALHGTPDLIDLSLPEIRVSVDHLHMLKLVVHEGTRDTVHVSPYGRVFIDACDPRDSAGLP